MTFLTPSPSHGDRRIVLRTSLTSDIKSDADTDARMAILIGGTTFQHPIVVGRCGNQSDLAGACSQSMRPGDSVLNAPDSQVLITQRPREGRSWVNVGYLTGELALDPVHHMCNAALGRVGASLVEQTNRCGIGCKRKYTRE